MKNSILFHVFRLCFISVFFVSYSVIAQSDVDIINLYNNYSDKQKEVVYVHLNKSTYIKGESIGFMAYVINKHKKSSSKLTKNLYISLEDEKGNILRQELLKVDNGVASSVLEMDSTFTSGYYTFKAFTNHMRNFKEQNYFIESIRIIDPEKETSIKSEVLENKIDAQFLPESGHIINGIVNNIGVVLKDTKGFGIPNASGKVTDQNNELITKFQVNKFGIGKFPLLAESDKKYQIHINYLNKNHQFLLDQKIEDIGISLSTIDYKDKVIIKLKTNSQSLDYLRNKKYLLTVHNGYEIEAFDIVFDKKQEILKVFDLKAMPPGINVFTLFNENNQPILERLFFNYNGIEVLKSNTVSVKKLNDSIQLQLNFKNIDSKSLNNVSVSVLPQETLSYNRQHNLISYAYLQPYIKGKIEGAKYYFTHLNQKKKLELDNLLITQGWSSYNWNNIFTPNNTSSFEFEQGIKVKANTNEGDNAIEATYMISKEESNEPFFFSVDNTNVNYFYIDSLFPVEYNRMYFSKFEKNNVYPTKLYFQVSPSKIPYLHSTNTTLKAKEYYKLETSLSSNALSFKSIRNVQQLEEVILDGQLTEEELRIKKLKKTNFGNIDIIGDSEIKKHMFLSNYLSANGFNASENHKYGILVVKNKGDHPINPKPPPLIYLNDFSVWLSDLYMLPLNEIDYISIEREVRGRNNLGVIRLYSYKGSRKEDNRKKQQEFTFPLTFSPKKTFYVPKYQYYNDDFYKSFGTIDWKPELVIGDNGSLIFNIEEPEVPITLFIEGFANDGSFIFEEKTISFN